MVSLQLRETLISEDKIQSDSEARDRILELESGKNNEFDQPAPGMWLLQRNSEQCCIYRVPNRLRRVNQEVYTPQLVIIGPLHHSLKSQALKSRGDITNSKFMNYLNVEQHKKFYLAEFARRLKGKQTIDGLRSIIKENEEMIRTSYSESTTWIESPQFVDMILHDSIFIMEFILRSYHEEREKTGDPLTDDPCLESTIDEDLVLLENQLPYVLLEKLFHPIVPTLIQDQTLRELIISHFEFKGKIRNNSKFKHFTDMVRLAHVETLPKLARRNGGQIIQYMHTASMLDSGGVKLEAVEDEFSLNVRFENGCLKMSCLAVDYRAEMSLRNVMALEQCHYFPYDTHVCKYVIFLDHLINTDKDVEVLVEKGIIKNFIGENGLVAEMVNKLIEGLVCYGSYYSDIADEVNAYYKNPITKAKAILKRVYFGNLWTGTATVAATFLLVMTLIQTVASIIQTNN